MSESTVPSLRHLHATRFVQPLKEGGSVPGLFEANDDGLYVVKLHGAAQGPKSLTAELIAGDRASARIERPRAGTDRSRQIAYRW
ncbi:MAG: hypothetical protein M9950_10100 [Thermomicrobiales bacterium]|nr:hypothetical protein [Thermomicrobiales bacterium]